MLEYLKLILLGAACVVLAKYLHEFLAEKLKRRREKKPGGASDSQK